jgi:HD-GYP domain-containing protein (c-di-GMP phosphodiesterase class II)
LGKLGVSNLVLDKPGPLSVAEVAQVRRHPALTAEILTPLDPLAEVAQVAAAHHERLDGSGYHQGLTRDTLPLLAQVVAAADVFDALTSERPYKTAQDPDSALRLMGRDAPRKLSAPVLTALAEAVTGERDGSGGIPQTARGQNH